MGANAPNSAPHSAPFCYTPLHSDLFCSKILSQGQPTGSQECPVNNLLGGLLGRPTATGGGSLTLWGLNASQEKPPFCYTPLHSIPLRTPQLRVTHRESGVSSEQPPRRDSRTPHGDLWETPQLVGPESQPTPLTSPNHQDARVLKHFPDYRKK